MPVLESRHSIRLDGDTVCYRKLTASPWVKVERFYT
jgi:hypothetical protein